MNLVVEAFRVVGMQEEHTRIKCVGHPWYLD